MSEQRADALVRIKQEKAQRDREEFEKEAQLTRHKFGPGKAAVRLLAGAYAHREVSDEEYGAALMRLAEAEGLALDVSVHRTKLSRKRLNLGDPSDRLRNIARGRGVLVVSDTVGCGWAEFFEAVFGGDGRVAVVNRATAEEICRAPDDLAIVFHDLSSGKDPDSRVGIVERIKNAHFDLPVVVFSDRDDVREMLRCLRAGAAGYFCYEPGAGLDRESVGTFEQFAGMVRDAIPPESWRQIWRELREFTGPIPGSDGANLYRRAAGHLRRAYWFLTADTADPRTQLLAADSLTKHVAMACGAAIETVLRTVYREYHRGLGASERVLRNLNSKVPNMLSVLTDAGNISPDQAQAFRTIWEVRNVATHEDGMTTTTQAETTLSHTIAVLARVLHAIRPASTGRRRGDLKSSEPTSRDWKLSNAGPFWSAFPLTCELLSVSIS